MFLELTIIFKNIFSIVMLEIFFQNKIRKILRIKINFHQEKKLIFIKLIFKNTILYNHLFINIPSRDTTQKRRSVRFIIVCQKRT